MYNDFSYAIHIDERKIRMLLGLDGWFGIGATLSVLHLMIIKHYVLIDYISCNCLVSDIRFILQRYITEVFLNK